MPFTFLSHQAPVLPLKLAVPRLVDGTALVIGSMAPDLAFVLRGTALYPSAHTLSAQLWFCLPLTMALTWVVKRHTAEVLGPHLPEGGTFHLRDYRLLAAWPARAGGRPDDRRVPGPGAWAVVAASALIGSFSHLVLDSFTHGYGWIVRRVAWLQTRLFDLPPVLTGREVHVNDVVQVVASLIGIVVSIWCLRSIGERRLLRDRYPDITSPRPTSHSRHMLRVWLAGGFVSGVLVAALMLPYGGLQGLLMRIVAVTAAGLLAGCRAARPHMEG